MATYFVFGGQGCARGIAAGDFAERCGLSAGDSAGVRGGQVIAADGPAPVLTAQAQLVQLRFWTVTAGAGAGVNDHIRRLQFGRHLRASDRDSGTGLNACKMRRISPAFKALLSGSDDDPGMVFASARGRSSCCGPLS
jgi:hypothetical protein